MNRKLARRLPLLRKWVGQLDILEEKYARLKEQRDELKADLTQAQAQLEWFNRERDKRRAQIHKTESQLPIPPLPLILRVDGKGDENIFLSYGSEIAASIKRLVTAEGLSFDSFSNILDFGCGCGRTIRFFEHHAESCNLFATDIDAEAIAWCQENLGNVATFDVNGDKPPTRYHDETFDFIYAISVFTHLPEALERLWLQELARISKPDGILLLTVHGERLFRQVPNASREELARRGFCYAKSGSTAGLPDYYQTSYHSEQYIRRHWSNFFHIKAIAPFGNQDAVICQKLPAN
jgi:SAM-dependent methyltransferase